MSLLKLFLVGTVSLSLNACGTYVPEIQEFPGDAADGQLLVQAIVHTIHCEIKDAVIYVLGKKGVKGEGISNQGAFMDNWGAQVALTLAVEEKTSASPSFLWSSLVPVTAFTLGGAASLSSDATRIDKLNFYYSVDALRSAKECKDQGVGPSGSLLIQSDLKLKELLLDDVMAVGTLEVGSPTNSSSILKQNVLSHEVKFEVVSTGSLTPAWKLKRVSIDQSGTLFSTTRDRTHDLLITFGPIDPTQKNGGLIPIAENAHLSSQFGLSVSSNTKSTPLP